MAALLAAVRTIIWTPLFLVGSALIALLALLVFPFPAAMRAVIRGWGWWNRALAAAILGQRVVVEGDLPRDAALVVMKHEAIFEAIDVQMLFDHPVVFAKRELFDIPLWGWLARRYGLIAIDRDAGASAVRLMRKAGQAAHAAGRPLILFPEGTRVPPGEAPPIRAGFAAIYALLRLPVVPVAVASGHLRRGWLRYPGVIRYRVGDVIPAGLPRAEAEARVHRAINALNVEGER